MFNGFLLLLLAHLLAEFVFQPDNLVKRKQELDINAYGIHIFFFVLLCIFLYSVVIDLTGKTILGLAVLSLFHGLWEYFLQRSGRLLKIRISAVVLFIMEQVVHILAIVIFLILWHGKEIAAILTELNRATFAGLIMWPQKLVIVACLLIIVTAASNTAIRLFLRPFKAETAGEPGKNNEEKELKIGRYIGSAERILTVFAVLAGSYEGLLALYASKTAIRYPKVKSEESFAEYYFLGTSVSAIIGIMVGLILKAVLLLNP